MNRIFVVTLVLFISLFSVNTVSAKSVCTDNCRYAERAYDNVTWVCCVKSGTWWKTSGCSKSYVKSQCNLNTRTWTKKTLQYLMDTYKKDIILYN